MEATVYVDNFRGFQDTYIPLLDVNFLLGENSTGKSSLIALTELLMHPEFHMQPEISFNLGDIKLGFYEDIVSASSANRTCFKVGFYGEREEDCDDFVATLLVFKRKKSLPFLSEFFFTSVRRKRTIESVRMIFQKQQLIYYNEEMPSRKRVDVESQFRAWTRIGAHKNKGYKKLPGPEFRTLPPALLASIYPFGGEIKSFGLVDCIPRFFRQGSRWLAPIRNKAKRTYDGVVVDFTPEGEHTPYLIRTLLRGRSRSSTFRKFLAAFGKDSGLFEGVEVEDFGKGPLDPFAVDVSLDGSLFKLINVGYGVAQCLPIIVEFFAARDNTVFHVQQPEIHLHPRAQAALGDAIFTLADEQEKRFVIETHSDFLIDRFRLHQRKYGEKSSVSSQVLFFVRKDGKNLISYLRIQPDGSYPSEQPKEFRQFFLQEQLRILGI